MTSLRLELAAAYPEIVASTLMPGVVATDFGKNALHGGPDSRTLRPVDEVAARLAQLIEQPRAETYSRPERQQLAAKYFAADDVGPIEAQFASGHRAELAHVARCASTRTQAKYFNVDAAGVVADRARDPVAPEILPAA